MGHVSALGLVYDRLQNKCYSVHWTRLGAYLSLNPFILQKLRLQNLAWQIRGTLLGSPLLHTFPLNPETCGLQDT